MHKELEIYYHRKNLNDIRESAKLTYLAFERYGDSYKLRAKKESQEKFFELTGIPSDIKPAHYNKLKEQVNGAF